MKAVHVEGWQTRQHFIVADEAVCPCDAEQVGGGGRVLSRPPAGVGTRKRQLGGSHHQPPRLQ